jgi:hypothetical protein
MIRRSPAEYYIKYLLLHPDKYGDDDVARILRDHQLDFPGGNYLSRLRGRMRVPRPFYPLNGSHQSSFRFLVDQKVHTFFFQDDKTEAAIEILNAPKSKEIVEAMTIVGDPLAHVVMRMSRLGLGTYRVKDLLRYQHFFWNLRMVDNLELKALMTKRIDDMLTDGSKVDLITYKAMKKAQYTDARFNAANAPSSLLAALRLQIRFGYTPNTLDTSRLAELGSALAAAGAADAAMTGGPRAAQDMRDYAIAAKELQNLRKLLGTPEESIRKDLQQLGVRVDPTEIPHIDTLTDGDYTYGAMLTEGKHVK